MISACLLGLPTRYDGKSKPDERVLKLSKDFIIVPFCPEQLGGLPTPRPRSEIRDGKVINEFGEDVTENFKRGAKISLEIAKITDPCVIILKSKSPSCGLRNVYDGTFSGKLVNGIGVTASALRDHGYRLITEEDLSNVSTPCEDLHR